MNNNLQLEVIKDEFKSFFEFLCKGEQKIPIQELKCAFLSQEKFELTTYDIGLELEFGQDILEVMKIIFEKQNFKYLEENNENYKKFILVANGLQRLNWIDWGTSIKGCWFIRSNEIKQLINWLESSEM